MVCQLCSGIWSHFEEEYVELRIHLFALAVTIEAPIC